MLTCPYCNQRATLVGGKAIYPHRPDLFSKFFYQCAPCGAYVGCHDAGTGQGDGTLAKGSPANADTRRARKKAHRAFDPMWTGRDRTMRRKEAYAWLANELGINVADCHIGEFDTAMCQRVVDAVEQLRMTS